MFDIICLFQKARFRRLTRPVCFGSLLVMRQGGMELPKNEPLTVVMCCKVTRCNCSNNSTC